MYIVSFVDFAETIRFSPSLSYAMSYVNRKTTYGVGLYCPVGNEIELPDAAKNFSFDEATVLSLTEEFGLDPNSQRHKVKVAELLAKRNAWLALLQAGLSGLKRSDIGDAVGGANKDIGIDFVTLTLGFNHPWIENKIDQLRNETHPNPNDFRDPEEILASQRQLSIREMEIESDMPQYGSQHQEMYQAEMENDISYWIDEFSWQDGLWRSEYEQDAYYAELDIKAAKQRINELGREIDKQEGLICKAQVPIRRFRNHENLKKTKAAQLESAKKKQLRKEIARKFFTMWVASLIEVLGVDSPAGLSRITGINKMAWWRRLHGKTVPPFTQISLLFDTRISNPDKSLAPNPYEGKTLQEIPTYPTSGDLAEILKLA